MKRKDLADLLSRAAACIENPDSLIRSHREELAEDLLAAEAEYRKPEAGTIRVRCTDQQLKNVSYIVKKGESVQGVLASGIAASLSYCGISGDEMAAKFEIGDAATPEEVIAVCKKRGIRNYLYEVI